MPRTTPSQIACANTHLMCLFCFVLAEAEIDSLSAGGVIGVCAATGIMSFLSAMLRLIQLISVCDSESGRT